MAGRCVNCEWNPSLDTSFLFQLKLYQTGERLVDRLDFEELALKSIDPSLGPSFTNISRRRLKALEKESDDGERVTVSRTF